MSCDYKPPFQITDEVINRVVKIAELIGMVSSTSKLNKNPTLRRKSRIKTILQSINQISMQILQCLSSLC